MYSLVILIRDIYIHGFYSSLFIWNISLFWVVFPESIKHGLCLNILTIFYWFGKKSSGISIILSGIRGVRGRVVRVVDLDSLAPHYCGFKSRHGLWILSCEEAIQLAYWTSVVLLRCPLVPEIMHARGEIMHARARNNARSWRNNARSGTWSLSSPLKLEIRHINFTLLVRC